jgi:hypothetical protein
MASAGAGWPYAGIARVLLVPATVLCMGAALSAADSEDAAARRHYYNTGGVHNDKGCARPRDCIAARRPGEPGDPLYPQWWTSEWTMYRVFHDYEKYPPPYASPPGGLTPADYEVSHGASYYDSTYRPADGDGEGAMMERYEERCLPIFPGSNHFSCAFVSLGNKAYFLRYGKLPAGVPACCRFSLQNHPPRRDFIKHLPYDPVRSRHLGGGIQAYARTMGGPLFGYAFEKEARADSDDRSAAPYRHPHSFFFSGEATDPPNAPMVSQNYRNFRMQRPDPVQIWEQAAQMCTPRPTWCCLFRGDCPDRDAALPQSVQPDKQWNAAH